MLNVAPLDAMAGGAGGRGVGELALHDEQLVLQTSDEVADVLRWFGQGGVGNPKLRAYLVIGAVRTDPRGILVYACTTRETGGSTIARAGIETRDTLASGRHGNWSSGELSPWTGQ